MTNITKASPKSWQLIAFIFARPVVLAVMALIILGGLFASHELFKFAVMSLTSK